jgi:hypothetical protein
VSADLRPALSNVQATQRVALLELARGPLALRDQGWTRGAGARYFKRRTVDAMARKGLAHIAVDPREGVKVACLTDAGDLARRLVW